MQIRPFSRKAAGVILIAILAGGLAEIALAQKHENPPKRAAALSDLYTLSSALQQFRLDCDRYPTTKEGLKALRICQPGLEKKWSGPYISRAAPNDPWGHAYEYKWPGKKGPNSFTLESRGPVDGASAITVEGPVNWKSKSVR